jgi:hypothetical protein
MRALQLPISHNLPMLGVPQNGFITQIQVLPAMFGAICVFSQNSIWALSLGQFTVMCFVVWSKSFGPLPQDWYEKYHNPTEADTSWYDPRKEPEYTLETMIAQTRPNVNAIERAHVLSFMLKGFSYDPRERITATQLLFNHSFQAVMETYGV